MVLADICPGLDNTLLIGIIIASQSARTVTMRKGTSLKLCQHPLIRIWFYCVLCLFFTADLSQRGVWNFTLRDSAVDFVNAALWGSPEYVQSCVEEFHIGTVGLCSFCLVLFFVLSSMISTKI